MYSDTLRGEILDHLFGLATWTAPAALWCGVSRAEPLADGSGLDEPTEDPSYDRVQYNPGAANWTRSLNVVDNDNVISFAPTTLYWGIITHICWFLTDVAATPYFYTALVTPKAVDIGDTPRFPSGASDNNLI
jgi:hypothetical protein